MLLIQVGPKNLSVNESTMLTGGPRLGHLPR